MWIHHTGCMPATIKSNKFLHKFKVNLCLTENKKFQLTARINFTIDGDKDVIFLLCLIPKFLLLPASTIVIKYSGLFKFFTKVKEIVLIRLHWWSVKIKKRPENYLRLLMLFLIVFIDVTFKKWKERVNKKIIIFSTKGYNMITMIANILLKNQSIFGQNW